MSIDLFSVIWLLGVAFFIFWQTAWGWRALRTGVATYYFHHEFSRADRPFQYWMLLSARGVGLIVGIGMFILGLNFLDA